MASNANAATVARDENGVEHHDGSAENDGMASLSLAPLANLVRLFSSSNASPLLWSFSSRVANISAVGGPPGGMPGGQVLRDASPRLSSKNSALEGGITGAVGTSRADFKCGICASSELLGGGEHAVRLLSSFRRTE